MLEAKDLSVFYGRHRALEKVDIHVDRGEICVILGANGAGKSTLLSVVAGLTRPEPGGKVLVSGTNITAMKPNTIVEQGIALVPEGGAIFGELTVRENLLLGAYPARARGKEAKTLEGVYKLFPVLATRKRQVARTMSGGEQKMLAIGRALMSNPDILMLDEPSLGLSPLLTSELFKALKTIGASGVGILLVEQNANQSLKIADRGYLLENGHIVGENSAAALAGDPAVRRAYLGGDGAVEHPVETRVHIPPALSLAGKSASEIAALAGELAAHAGAVHAAHVLSARSVAARPNASAGHASSAKAPSAGASHQVSPDAAALSRMAGALAERAAAVHADYIASRRDGQPMILPSATVAAPAPAATAAAPAPSTASELTRMAERFAERAAAMGARPNGAAPVGRLNGSAGAAESIAPIEATPKSNGGRPDEQAQTLSASAADLAARAAALHQRHVAAIRQAGATPGIILTGYTRYDEDAAPAREKKRHKNGKKKHKKARKRCGKSKGD